MHRNQAPVLRAGGTINPACFITISTAAPHTCLQAGVGNVIAGISQKGPKFPQGLIGPPPTYAAAAGDEIDTFSVGDICRLIVGAVAVTAGALLVSDANGNGVVATPGLATVQWVGALTLEDANPGEMVEVQVVIMPVTFT